MCVKHFSKVAVSSVNSTVGKYGRRELQLYLLGLTIATSKKKDYNTRYDSITGKLTLSFSGISRNMLSF